MRPKTTTIKPKTNQQKGAPPGAAGAPTNQEIRRALALPGFVKVTDMPDQFVLLTGRGVLIVDSKTRGPVVFEAKSFDEMTPGLMELYGGSELLPIGTPCETVKLEIAGVRIRTELKGWRKDTGAILVLSEPVFRGLAKAIKATGGAADSTRIWRSAHARAGLSSASGRNRMRGRRRLRARLARAVGELLAHELDFHWREISPASRSSPSLCKTPPQHRQAARDRWTKRARQMLGQRPARWPAPLEPLHLDLRRRQPGRRVGSAAFSCSSPSCSAS
jgi:hypothetical protein